MYVSLLGEIEVQVAGRALPLGGPHRISLVALLALRAGNVVPVSELIETLWDGAPPRSALANVHGHVSALRNAIRAAGLEAPERVLVTRPPGYLIDPAYCQTDLGLFEELREQAWSARSDPSAAAALYAKALTCWRGPALLDVGSALLRRHAEHLEERRLQTVCDKAEAQLELGLHHAVALELRPLVDAHPYDERLRAVLMLALYRGSRQAEALTVYREGRRALVQDLGLEPGPELRQLEAAILSQEPAHPATTSTASPVLATLRPRQLPPAPSLLIGRSAQIDALHTALTTAPPTSLPVLVVTGPVGAGKSALALHLAHQLQATHPDGQLYADLTEDPGLILVRFLRTLGVPPDAVPDPLPDRVALFRTLTADRRILLLLDDASDESRVRPLLPGGPTCSVVITARRPLTALDNTATIRLAPLPDHEATSLFTALTGATPGPAVVRLCDGLPSAIRAAAALLQSRPHWFPSDLAAWLSDDHRRLNLLTTDDQNLQTSYARVTSSLQAPARRALSVLALGPATPIDLSKALAIPESDAEELLEHLADHHLATPRRSGPTWSYALPTLLRLHLTQTAA
ncbi:AfsR/SARP family transcriptional regulator [Actinomadura harenae]|uniref:AfsR/SARP family transcriptional regulator n=1 Tax=Actinomadura harenae TaxID=2483351 RepID=A0A3M2M4T0_9ACTN|nr:BTAD domain-containing putative transcriptional regulator [Actinomadura harenae]RMI44040.1 AfsR/SARP family transcriptional regulator [Actinomadura harenae]